MTHTAPPPEIWTRSVARMIVRLVLYVLGAVLLMHVVARLQALIATLFVAMTIAYIVRPLAMRLVAFRVFRQLHNLAVLPFLLLLPKRYRPTSGLPRRALEVVAAFYVMVMLFVVGWYSARFLFSPFTTEIKNVQENWGEYRERLQSYERSFRDWYRREVKPEFREWIENQFKATAGNGMVRTSPASWLGIGIRRTGEYVMLIVDIVLIPVLAFYFAVESRTLKRDFVSLLPRRRRRAALRLIHDFNQIMYSFVVCQAVLCLIAGVVVGIGLAALGVPYPVSLGVLAGITRAIPVIGPIFGGIPIVLLALVTKGLVVAAWVLVFFSILHFVESKFIMPLLIGDSLELHPVVIIVVLLIGQEFAGLLGMFFAAPVAALCRVALQRYWIPRASHATQTPASSV